MATMRGRATCLVAVWLSMFLRRQRAIVKICGDQAKMKLDVSERCGELGRTALYQQVPLYLKVGLGVAVLTRSW